MVDQRQDWHGGLRGRDRWRVGLLTGAFAIIPTLLLQYAIGLHSVWWLFPLIGSVIGGLSGLLAWFVVKKWPG